MIVFIWSGAIQLLVGPASFSSTEQMKVRSSTRATSEGSEAQWNELGLRSSLRRVNVPEATSPSVSVFHSWSEPVTHEMRSGVVSAATSATQAASRLWLVEPSLWICSLVVLVICPAIPFAWRPLGRLWIVSQLSPSDEGTVNVLLWVTVTRAARWREWATLDGVTEYRLRRVSCIGCNDVTL